MRSSGGHRRLSRAEAGAGIADPLGMLTARDSAINAAMFERANAGKAGYVTQGIPSAHRSDSGAQHAVPENDGDLPFRPRQLRLLGGDGHLDDGAGECDGGFRRRRQTGDKDGRRRPQKESGIVAPYDAAEPGMAGVVSDRIHVSALSDVEFRDVRNDVPSQGRCSTAISSPASLPWTI